jgi:hypothetical protein
LNVSNSCFSLKDYRIMDKMSQNICFVHIFLQLIKDQIREMLNCWEQKCWDQA